MKRVVIIGAGIGGLASAALLAEMGYDVAVYEQHGGPGGRAHQFTQDGFVFDAGPSWYLMPEVFEHFFALLGEKLADHITLSRLDPAYAVYFEGQNEPIEIHANLDIDAATFDAIEPGAGVALRRYVADAEQTYLVALDSFLHTTFASYKPFMKPTIVRQAPKMMHRAVQSLDAYAGRFMRDRRLKQILEYPMVFLGTSPFKAPALYSLMSHLDFNQGVFYPQGGLYTVITAVEALARQRGVGLHYNAPVVRINTKHGHTTGIELATGEQIAADIVISNADLHFTETALLAPSDQTYSEKYWRSKEPGPSAILMYLGVKGDLPQLRHHTLVFTKDWHKNFGDVFDKHRWPAPASLYISNPSKSDPTVAPPGHENLFVLVPGPAGPLAAADEATLAQTYLEQIEQMVGIPDLRQRIVTQNIVGPSYFYDHLHAWRGTALGMSHVLTQSAFLRPRNHSKKVDNLYYVGGSTQPGIGLPMCLISAQLLVKRLVGDTSTTPMSRLPEIA